MKQEPKLETPMPKKQKNHERCGGYPKWMPAKPLAPRNEQQHRYMGYISDLPIVIATGYAGTGKTYIATRIAAEMLKNGLITQIMMTRPNVTASKSVGYFPGTKIEKMSEWLAPVLGALKEEFSPFSLKGMLHPELGNVGMCPLELIKGLSLKKTFLIVDEAEDLTIKEIKAILTRIGNQSKIVLCGDIHQTDLKNCGLTTFLRMLENDPDLQSIVGHIDFNNPGAIVRSQACKKIILGFEKAQL